MARIHRCTKSFVKYFTGINLASSKSSGAARKANLSKKSITYKIFILCVKLHRHAIVPFWKDWKGLKLQNSHSSYVVQSELYLEKTDLELHGVYQTLSLLSHSHGLSGLMGSWLNALSEQVTWGSTLKAAHQLAESPLVSIKSRKIL